MRSRVSWLPLAVSLLACASTAAQDSGGRLNVAFLIWDGMELIESMGPAHVFSFAPGMDEYTVSATTEPIRSEFVTIVPEYTFADCPPPDVIVIPGGSIGVPLTGQAYRRWLTEQVPRTRLTVSVCNSAILLADLGLLDGREATCGDSNLDDIMLLGKDVRGYINRRWVHDGNIITAESYLGGLDAAIYAVRVLRGAEGERQVLGWSNYDGDLSRFDAMHAEPGIIPVSRRREIVAILMRDGVDAAVKRYRDWVESGEPAYTPPLDRFEERDLFQWMAWGNQGVGRHEVSLRICRFKARAWPDSARERAYLGEALMKADHLDEALDRLLEALQLDEGDRVALSVTKALLRRPDAAASEGHRRARAILRRHPDEGRAVLVSDGEPGAPLRVSGTVRDARGGPIEGALLYVFHADAGGQYAKTGPIGQSGARLFAFVRTGADGQYEFRTVRPGAAPDPADRAGGQRQVPARIHFEVSAAGYEDRRFELVFEDDPSMASDRWQEWARRNAHPIASVEVNDEGVSCGRCDIVLRPIDD